MDRPLPPIKPYPMPTSEVGGVNVPKGKELFYFVLDCLEKEQGRAEIREKLMALGYAEEDTYMIVADVAERRRQFVATQAAEKPDDRGDAGRWNMIVGGIIFLLGIGITIGSFLIDQEGRTGYLIAFGPMIFGGIQFLRGLIQSQKS